MKPPGKNNLRIPNEMEMGLGGIDHAASLPSRIRGFKKRLRHGREVLITKPSFQHKKNSSIQRRLRWQPGGIDHKTSWQCKNARIQRNLLRSWQGVINQSIECKKHHEGRAYLQHGCR
jgi:hypothetical protein